MRRTAVLRRAALSLLLLLLLHAGAFRGASADELADDDDDQLTLGEEPPPAPKGKRMPGDSEGVIREGQSQQQEEEAPEAQKVEDPLKPAVMLALQKPALFGQRLKVHFEQTNEEADLVVHKGEVPLEVLGTFADENEMGEEEREMAARALARTQLELAWCGAQHGMPACLSCLPPRGIEPGHDPPRQRSCRYVAFRARVYEGGAAICVCVRVCVRACAGRLQGVGGRPPCARGDAAGRAGALQPHALRAPGRAERDSHPGALLN
jgi:hypothetical protein